MNTKNKNQTKMTHKHTHSRQLSSALEMQKFYAKNMGITCAQQNSVTGQHILTNESQSNKKNRWFITCISDIFEGLKRHTRHQQQQQQQMLSDTLAVVDVAAMFFLYTAKTAQNQNVRRARSQTRIKRQKKSY